MKEWHVLLTLHVVRDRLICIHVVITYLTSKREMSASVNALLAYLLHDLRSAYTAGRIASHAYPGGHCSAHSPPRMPPCAPLSWPELSPINQQIPLRQSSPQHFLCTVSLVIVFFGSVPPNGRTKICAELHAARISRASSLSSCLL